MSSGTDPTPVEPKRRRGIIRWLDDKYYDLTSIVREPRHVHHGRRVPGDYDAPSVLAVLFGIALLRALKAADDFNRDTITAMAIVLGVFALRDLVRRIPLVEILDALSVLASAVAHKGMQVATSEVKIPGFLRKKTTEETEEVTTSTTAPPAEGGTTE